ncbi:MAG: bifunctional adenosylcobinamide kinase/adenosylcobinamide-phosphate guanylyltransferase [Verrucomicrobiota bacterium]
MNSKIWFVLGGCRSGKSSRAQQIASAAAGADPVVYVATCRTENLDAEMRGRVQRHQSDRPSSWETIEDRFDLETIAAEFPNRVMLLDCLTLWLAHWSERDSNMERTLARIDAGMRAFRDHGIRIVVVSNEVGAGLVPVGAENRDWRDLVGFANQRVAKEADCVEWVVAGIPTTIKG